MRIALVAHQGSPLTPATGQEPMSQAASIAAHARGLAKLGHRVTIYARRDSRALPGSAILAPRVNVEHITAGPLAPLSGAELAGTVAEFSDQLAARWRRNAPGVVHAYFWTSGLAALSATHGTDIPVVQTFGTLGVAERRHGSAMEGNDVRIRLEACLARNADAVLASTDAEAADLVNMGVPRASVTVVPCGVDTAEFTPEGPAAKRGSRPRLLAVVPQLDGHQGLGTLLRMLTRVPGAELVIAGGPARSQLRKDEAYQQLTGLAERLGVADRVSFTGKIAAGGLPALLRSADLLVSGAPYEPSGAIALAAMACGVPVAAPAAGACADAVLDATTGAADPAGAGRPVRAAGAGPAVQPAAAGGVRDRRRRPRDRALLLGAHQPGDAHGLRGLLAARGREPGRCHVRLTHPGLASRHHAGRDGVHRPARLRIPAATGGPGIVTRWQQRSPCPGRQQVNGGGRAPPRPRPGGGRTAEHREHLRAALAQPAGGPCRAPGACVLGCHGRAVARERACRARRQSSRPARARRRAAVKRARAGAGRPVRRRPGELPGHTGGDPVAGVRQRGPAPWCALLRDARLPVGSRRGHPLPGRRAPALPGIRPARRAAHRLRWRGHGQRRRIRRRQAHRAPVARGRGVTCAGGPGQGNADAGARLQRRRRAGAAAADLPGAQSAGHRCRQDDHRLPRRAGGTRAGER